MARFEPADIDEVRDRADIVEIVSEHVRLKKSGRSYRGLCPFHQEKTPSFDVDRDKGVYICRGCGEGGNVFTFVSKVENLTFPEAVETLAQRYGVTLREVAGTKRAESPRSRITAVHEESVDLYRKMLESREGAPVREYLDSRGLTVEQRERHAVGFGGWARDGIVRALVRKGFTHEELLTAGLASRDGRALRDTFHGRVLFPIFDAGGKAVGFGGRVLPEAFRREGAPDGPKYLNTRESPVFHKSRILYGANWARGDIARAKRLVIVEGYTDVIALQSVGLPETVATCGTSLTEQHMQDISRRFGDVRVVLCLDADAAGQAAMSRAGNEELAGAYSPGETVKGGWLPVGRGWLPEVYVATLPEGQDPADFVLSGGGSKLADIIDAAMPLVEFLLGRAIATEPLTTPEGRSRAVRKGAEVLSQVGDSLLRHEYALWLADRAGVSPYEVTKIVETRAGRPVEGRARGPQPGTQMPVALTDHQRVEREALRALVSEPVLMRETELQEDDFTLPLHRALFRLFTAEQTESGRVDAGRLVDRVQDADLRKAVSELAVGESPSEIAGRETLLRLREFALARNIDECKAQLRKLDPEREAVAYDALFEKMVSLEMQKRALISGR